MALLSTSRCALTAGRARACDCMCARAPRASQAARRMYASCQSARARTAKHQPCSEPPAVLNAPADSLRSPTPVVVDRSSAGDHNTVATRCAIARLLSAGWPYFRPQGARSLRVVPALAIACVHARLERPEQPAACMPAAKAHARARSEPPAVLNAPADALRSPTPAARPMDDPPQSSTRHHLLTTLARAGPGLACAGRTVLYAVGRTRCAHWVEPSFKSARQAIDVARAPLPTSVYAQDVLPDARRAPHVPVTPCVCVCVCVIYTRACARCRCMCAALIMAPVYNLGFRSRADRTIVY